MTKPKLRRWRCRTDSCKDDLVHMTVREEGEFVLFSDYEKEIIEIIKERNTLMDAAISSLISNHEAWKVEAKKQLKAKLVPYDVDNFIDEVFE